MSSILIGGLIGILALMYTRMSTILLLFVVLPLCLVAAIVAIIYGLVELIEIRENRKKKQNAS